MPHPPLLLTSNAPPPSDNPGVVDAPRLDFVALAAALGGAPLLYPSPARGLISRIEERTASDLRQAWIAWRCRARVGVFVSLSEKVGVPLALLLKRNTVPHVLVAHHLTSERKRSLQERTGYLHRFSRIVVLCRAQERYLREELGLPADRVRFVYDKVDHNFWKPCDAPGADGPDVLAVGRERRDYETLAASARRLPRRSFVVVASSPWSRGAGNAPGTVAPDNLTFRQNLSWTELRRLYTAARIVVAPLQAGTAYAAGVNAVLEAMAMAKPLLVSRTPGIEDYLCEGENGRFVPAGDADALGASIEALLTDHNSAARLARQARLAVEEGRNLTTYVANLAAIVREALHDA